MDLIDALMDLGFGHGREMGVDGGGGRRSVTQIGLDDPQIDTRFQQMGGIGVEQGMDGSVLVNPTFMQCLHCRDMDSA
jgi:hypothetical protein